MSVSALDRLRGKLGATLNLKPPSAREIFADLVRQADVVVENFSAGTLDRLGFGYEWARQVNPRIVFCAFSGFGADKASAGGKAMDLVGHLPRHRRRRGCTQHRDEEVLLVRIDPRT